jgi:GH15 family glucan-1,4-alpha-glucosidase
MNDKTNAASPLPIEDYALIGNCQSAALVGRNGSIDWLCWPYFDSDACFAALLGSPNHGRWLIAPAAAEVDASRRYRGDTMILETLFETTEGSVTVVDFMPIGLDTFSIVRRVQGRRGRVAMHMQLTLRFEYGSVTPWVTRLQSEPGIEAIGGPNRVVLRSGVPVHGEDQATVARFIVAEGQAVEFTLSWGPSHLPIPEAFDTADALSRTKAFWRDWSERCSYKGAWREPVLRSLLTLKALSFLPTGALVAAPTTSLPERLAGPRNWDYRFCWLRDATLTLVALMAAGFIDEAAAWRNWLHRAVAGNPDDVQIMYGLRGERRLFRMVPRLATWISRRLPGARRQRGRHTTATRYLRRGHEGSTRRASPWTCW